MKHFISRRLSAAVGIGCLILALGTAQAACPSNSSRYVANGAEVTDTQTGLIWQRCSVGQTFVGATCSGGYLTYTHEDALSYARTASGAQGWRLPDVKELASLVDAGCTQPAIDATMFPITASVYYWSSTPGQGTTGAMSVSFSSGGVVIYPRFGTAPIRLVRTAPQ